MPIKVLHVSTHNEACGIGKYQEMFLLALRGDHRIQNEIFEVSPSRIPGMESETLAKTLDLLRERLQGFDVLHIQHEFTYFPGDTLTRISSIAKELKKKLVVTVHTGIAVLGDWAPFVLNEPRDIARYIKRSIKMRARKNTLVQNLVASSTLADVVLVHNEKAKADLVTQGVPESRFKKIVIPVPVVGTIALSQMLDRRLRRDASDIIIGVVGFINKLKGTADAVEALALLPPTYKLAIIGGLHPHAAAPYGDQGFLDKLLQRIDELSLGDRVYITGYVKDDDELNALVSECDLCAYPYDKVQYGNSSSAALNNAFANHRPVVTYPTEPFKEINALGGPYLQIAQDFTPEEIARSIQNIDLPAAQRMSAEFGERYSYPVVAGQLANLYVSLVG